MASTSRRRRCYGDTVQKFISRFPDLIYDSPTVFCLVCNKRLLAWDAGQCKRHVQSARHIQRKNSSIPYAIFLYDYIFMLTACNLPFHLIRRKEFQVFWNKYVPQWKLPSNTSLRRYLPDVKQRLENEVKNKLRDQKLWMTLAETTDSKENSILNILVRTVCPNKISNPYLLACKRIQECTADNIKDVITSTLDKFDTGTEQIVMLVTDDAPTMLCVGRSLKLINSNLIHVTCLLQALHLVADVVRQSYKCVDQLVESTKKIFRKSPKRIRELREQYPDIPRPPQLISTRWGTWLEAVFYYCDHFDEIKRVVMTFDRNESEAVKNSQEQFENPQILDDLHTISANYKILYEATQTLEKKELLLKEALDIVNSVNTKLQTLTDFTGMRTSDKMKDVLIKNPDFGVVETIYLKCNNSEPLSDIEQQILYANITALDAERSISIYKNIFSSRRTSFNESTVEAQVMIQIYGRSHEEMPSSAMF